MSYKRRPPPQFYNLQADGGKKRIRYKKGNMPHGPVGESIKGNFVDTDSAIKAALIDSVIKEDETQEVKIDITKGHYLGTGNLIKLNVEEPELRRTHRIKSRTINWSESAGVKSSFVLNKDVPLMKEYIFQ